MSGALVLKSKNKLTNTIGGVDYTLYKERVLSDGGIIVNEQATLNAMRFSSSIGINSYNDVGCVSPQWGVKYVAGRLVKMYSLHNPDADVSVTLSVGMSDVTKFKGFDVIELLGTAGNAITSNEFEVTDSLVSMNINSVTQNEPLGGYTYAQTNVYSRTPPEGSDKNMLLDYYYSAPTLTDTTDKWDTTVDFSSFAGNTYRDKITTGNAGGFLSNAIYLDKNGVQAYAKGVKALEKAPYDPISFSGVPLVAEYARRGSGTWTTPAINFVTEIWLVRDVSPGIAQKLSEYSHAKYGAA